MLVLAARQLPEWYATLGINGSDGRSRHARLVPFAPSESVSFLDLWSEKNGVDVSGFDTVGVTEAAGGNPFYLSELVGHLARGGAKEQAPATIRTLVELQYAALPKSAQRTLLTVGLLQKHAGIERVADVLQLPSSALMEALEALEACGLVATSGTLLSIRHDLVADVALSLAPPSVVAYLRVRVASVLQANAESVENVELLADALTHWERASASQKAFEVASMLGARLMSLGLGLEACTAFERALLHARSAEELAIARRSRVSALRAANSWETLSDLDLSESLLAGRPGDGDDEALIAQTEARLWFGGVMPASGLLESRFLDPSLSLDLRLQAAIVALIAHDNHFVAQDFLAVHGKDLLILSSDPNGPEDRCLLLELMVRVCAGQKDRAVEVADLMLSRVAKFTPGERVRYVRHVAHAMLRVGRTLEAEGLFAESRALARALRLPHHEAASVDFLFRVAAHRANAVAASTHSRVLRELAESISPGHLYLSWACFADASIAWLAEDSELAQTTLTRLEAFSDMKQLRTSRHAVYLARAALGKFTPELLDDETIAWCRTLGDHVLTRGCQDLTAILSAIALDSAGEPTNAVTQLHRYVRSLRVESGPIAPGLVSRLPQHLLVGVFSQEQ
jgi:hypothetical protein